MFHLCSQISCRQSCPFVKRFLKVLLLPVNKNRYRKGEDRNTDEGTKSTNHLKKISDMRLVTELAHMCKRPFTDYWTTGIIFLSFLKSISNYLTSKGVLSFCSIAYCSQDHKPPPKTVQKCPFCHSILFCEVNQAAIQKKLEIWQQTDPLLSGSFQFTVATFCTVNIIFIRLTWQIIEKSNVL